MLYYRAPGKKQIKLRGPFGSPEFMADYLAASTNTSVFQEPKTSSISVTKGTMTWLVHEYYQSGTWKALRETPQNPRRNILKNFLNQYGKIPYSSLTQAQARKIRDKKANTTDATNNLMKALSAVFEFATEYGHRGDNPIRGIGKLKPKRKGGHVAWSVNQVRQFEEHYPIGTKPRLALALLLYTGQRRSDIVKLGRQHERDGWLYFRQQKTDAEMSIPIFRELREVLNNSAGIVGDLNFLVTAWGKPFTANGFGNAFRRWVQEAGLDGLSPHGLRKAAAQILAENGHSTHEIAAIGGWETLSEVQRYTKGAERKRLAQRVINARENRQK